MRTREFGVLAAALLVAAGACGLTPARSAAAGTPGTTNLGNIGFAAIVVDSTHKHVFISGSTANEVLVTDLSGNLVKTIDNQSGAAGMVIYKKTLFVAESTAGVIGRIDLGTLTPENTIGSGLNGVWSLAVAGGKLWTAVGSSYGYNQLVSVSLAGTVTTY